MFTAECNVHSSGAVGNIYIIVFLFNLKSLFFLLMLIPEHFSRLESKNYGKFQQHTINNLKKEISERKNSDIGNVKFRYLLFL